MRMRCLLAELLLIGTAVLCVAAEPTDPARTPATGSVTPGRYLDEAQIIEVDHLESGRRRDLLRIGALWQMDEPVWLTSLPDVDEVYRLWYKPPFTDMSIVRLTHRRGMWVLSVRTQAQQFLVNRLLIRCVMSPKQSDPTRCSYPPLKVDLERPLEAAQADPLVLQLRSLDLSDLPPPPSPPAFDGVQWTLEVLRDGRSYELQRSNPPPGAFLQAARELVALAGIPQ